MITLSREARCWAVQELARRAGVTREFFNSWRIETRSDATIIHVQPGTAKQIHFRNLSAEYCVGITHPRFQTVHAGWMASPKEPLREMVPDFIVPFCEESRPGRRPLFQRPSNDRIECSLDLPASTLFSLCRVEEYLQENKDSHARPTAASSVAGRDGFLDRPIVDEYGLALEQALEALVPRWRPGRRTLRAKISHDVDEVGDCARIKPVKAHHDLQWLGRTAWMAMPFDLRHAIRTGLRQGTPIEAAMGLARALRQPSCLELVRTVVTAPLQRNLYSVVYWKASRLGPYDSGYDPRDPRVQTMISWLRDHGVENGVHPGYETFRHPAELRTEVDILRSVFNEQLLGGRQHYLRWCPETWLDWENCGLAYDNTVGYADCIGFKAGTCIPYRPWLLSKNREAHLLEIPLLVMDTTLLDYMRLSSQKMLEMVSTIITRCRTVGGVFTFLCHNTSMRIAPFVEQYHQILDMLDPSEHFDWRSRLSDQWLPQNVSTFNQPVEIGARA